MPTQNVMPNWVVVMQNFSICVISRPSLLHWLRQSPTEDTTHQYEEKWMKNKGEMTLSSPELFALILGWVLESYVLFFLYQAFISLSHEAA